jgi:hypothetical protein
VWRDVCHCCQLLARKQRIVRCRSIADVGCITCWVIDVMGVEIIEKLDCRIGRCCNDCCDVQREKRKGKVTRRGG